MNESVSTKRDYSGIIGIGIVLILLAVLLPLSINAIAAGEPDLSDVSQLSLGRTVNIQVNSSDEFPVLSFTPDESGKYLLQITTSSGLHVRGSVDEYSKSGSNGSVVTEGTLFGDYFYSSGDVGYQFKDVGLEAGRTYYFVTAQDSRYSFGRGGLACLITKTGDEELQANFCELFPDQKCSARVDSEDDFPYFFYTPTDSGEYILQITTSSRLHINRNLYKFSAKNGDPDSLVHDETLVGDYYYSSGDVGYEYDSVYMESGNTYIFATSQDSRYSFAPGTVSCLLKKVGTTPHHEGDYPLTLGQITSVRVGSSGEFPILSYTPSGSGEYLLQITTSSSLHVSGTVETYKKSGSGAVSPSEWMIGDYFYDYIGGVFSIGYQYENLKLEAGNTYYFVTAKDSRYSFDPGDLNCLITKTREDPGLTAKDVTGTYGDVGLKVVASTVGNSPLKFSVISGKDVVSVDANTGQLTVYKAGTAKIRVTAAETAAYCEATTEVTVVIRNAASNPFRDVKQGSYYYDPVLWAVNYQPQITNGTGPNTFSPETTCTRGQVVTFLWRAKGCPEPRTIVNPFSDVPANAYYYKAVLWAVENGITNGTGANTFSPESPCTRAHVVTFLWRTANKPAAGSSNPFKDVPSGQYYTDAVLWAVNHNPQITNGTSANTFSPDNPCTRGQIVTFLYRYMK